MAGVAPTPGTTESSVALRLRPDRVHGTLYTDLVTCTPTGEVKGRVEYGTDKPVTARFVRFTVIGHGLIEDGFPGAGHAPWTFLDEVHIR